MKRSLSIGESGVPTRRSKSQFAHLTSDPVSEYLLIVGNSLLALSLLLKKIEDGDVGVVKEYLSESNGEELLSFLESGHDRKSSEVS